MSKAMPAGGSAARFVAEWRASYTLEMLCFALALPFRRSGSFGTVDAMQDVEGQKPQWTCSSGEASEQGMRPAMEDAAVARDVLPGGSGNESLYAVFDGHGGWRCAAWMANELSRRLVTHMRIKPQSQALHDCFCAMDKLWLSLLTDAPALTMLEDPFAVRTDDSGCVGCAVLVDHRGLLLCANAGDSRALLCRGGEALPLSEDHKATRPDEVARYVAAGGSLHRARVGGELAVSRALGDAPLKVRAGVVIPDPDVTVTPLQADDEFIIVACDGVFDVLSNQEAVRTVRASLRRGHSERRAARTLVHTALTMGSTDNVSAIVIVLHHHSDDDGGDATPPPASSSMSDMISPISSASSSLDSLDGILSSPLASRALKAPLPYGRLSSSVRSRPARIDLDELLLQRRRRPAASSSSGCVSPSAAAPKSSRQSPVSSPVVAAVLADRDFDDLSDDELASMMKRYP
eukprot:PLAT8399.2.p1 GENE.PLAT8399.2~~PLAT8399.2.p1  ORF type:complete len:462 (+),score=169.16 PLAT8399.2:322-1707(+)